PPCAAATLDLAPRSLEEAGSPVADVAKRYPWLGFRRVVSVTAGSYPHRSATCPGRPTCIEELNVRYRPWKSDARESQCTYVMMKRWTSIRSFRICGRKKSTLNRRYLCFKDLDRASDGGEENRRG